MRKLRRQLPAGGLHAAGEAVGVSVLVSLKGPSFILYALMYYSPATPEGLQLIFIYPGSLPEDYKLQMAPFLVSYQTTFPFKIMPC